MSNKIFLTAYTGATPVNGGYAEYINAYLDNDTSMVEITIRLRDGETHSIEMPITEFVDLVNTAEARLSK